MLGPKKVQFPTPRRAGQPRQKPSRQRVPIPPPEPKPKPKLKPKVQTHAPKPKKQKAKPPPEPEVVEPNQIEEPPKEVTLDDVAAQANEILEQMTRSGLMKSLSHAPKVELCDLNSLAEIRESVERLPPIQIETRSSLFNASKVKTPTPGFSIRKRPGAPEKPQNVDYLTETEAPLERLDTASELIYPDGRRTQVPAK